VRKLIATLVAATMVAGSVCACSKAPVQSSNLKIVTTIFPQYDWVMNILGDNPAKADVTLLQDTGADLHSFQPTAADIIKVSECDLFIYVGGESDEWVDDVLKEATNKNMVVIDLMDELGDSVKEEEVVEGMQEEDEHEHDHDEDHEHEDHDHEGHEHHHEEGEIEYDEHVWLSLKNAKVLVKSISGALQKIDPANASVYKTNEDVYVAKLDGLDKQYQEAVDSASVDTLLFGDRFPFRYLVDDYGLSYYAAFVGCSAESEASFETITFLSRKTDELSLHAVLTIEGKDHKIAETIVDNTVSKDQKILTMDSMQSVTAADVAAGASYFSIMESNLGVLKEALK